jgi:hypothetical protein
MNDIGARRMDAKESLAESPKSRWIRVSEGRGELNFIDLHS